MSDDKCPKCGGEAGTPGYYHKPGCPDLIQTYVYPGVEVLEAVYGSEDVEKDNLRHQLAAAKERIAGLEAIISEAAEAVKDGGK